jgi:hypothetical protein
MPEAINAIVQAILASPAPVLMPDTCSLLNVLETPTPDENVSPNIVPATQALLARLQANPATLWMVVAQTVEEEWQRHRENKRDRAIRSIRSADERISFLWSIASSMASAPAGPHIQFAGLQIAQRLHEIAERIIRTAKVIQADDAFHAAAGIRIVAGRAPATAGKKPEVNGCVLIEQYLALCRGLRAAGFTERLLTISRLHMPSSEAGSCQRKNITLSVDERVLEAVRRHAAERNSSVNALVREYLTSLAVQHDRAQTARARLRELSAQSKGRLGRKDWTRANLHER